MLSTLDNLAAVMVGGAVLFIMMAMQLQVQEASVERTAHYMAKRAAIETGSWIQEDIANIGAGIENLGAGHNIEALQTGAHQMTETFTFKRKLAADDATWSRISYVLDPRDTVIVKVGEVTETVTLYALQRKVDGVVDGESPPLVTDFRVEPLDEDGGLAASWEEATQVRVRFATVARYIERIRYLRKNHWATTVPLRGRG